MQSQLPRRLLLTLVWLCLQLKNEESLVHQAARSLRTRFRLILTGTPVQNNLRETYSLLSYLEPHIFKVL